MPDEPTYRERIRRAIAEHYRRRGIVLDPAAELNRRQPPGEEGQHEPPPTAKRGPQPPLPGLERE